MFHFRIRAKRFSSEPIKIHHLSNTHNVIVMNLFPRFCREMAVLSNGREEGDIQVNLTNCNFNTLVIGHRNTVNNYSRRLEYGEPSTTSRSRGTVGTTAIQDSWEIRGTKRKQSKIPYPQRKHRPDRTLRSKRGSSESEEEFGRYNSPETFPAASCDSEQMGEFYASLKRLHPLRDSGNWKEFNSIADGIMKVNQGDLAVKLLNVDRKERSS